MGLRGGCFGRLALFPAGKKFLYGTAYLRRSFRDTTAHTGQTGQTNNPAVAPERGELASQAFAASEVNLGLTLK